MVLARATIIALSFLASIRTTAADAVGAIRRARIHWHVEALTWDPAHLVLLDETGVTNHLLRRYGRVGATLVYLPPYSPDLNPIELCFAKQSSIVCAARCRSIETRWSLLGACLPRFSADECQNYFRHCGYTGAKRL